MTKNTKSETMVSPNAKKRKRSSTTDIYDTLLTWASHQGIALHHITPQRIPGRGVGIVATKPLKAGALLLHVPTTSLRTIDTIPRPIIRSHPKDTPVHGLLATTLALDATPTYSAWNAVVPTRQSITSSLPLTWPTALHAFLPLPAASLFTKQLQKFTRDWTTFTALYPDSLVARAEYMYHWLLVNTRTFYHETPKTRRNRLPREDRMVLQPVADLFNHSDSGCNVSFDASCFTITADRAYEKGEEVYICYGSHGNDFLLVEYGFVMTENKWDEVSLDEAILPELSARQREMLEEKGFLGKYVLDAETVCYRTQVAARMLCVSGREWTRFVDEGEGSDEEAAQAKTDERLVGILNKYKGRIRERLEELRVLEDGEVSQREMLALRWRQIEELVGRTIARLETSK
ncbi:hypothetical protein OQA88_7280 [Cercophora sp. LCS_1]